MVLSTALHDLQSVSDKTTSPLHHEPRILDGGMGFTLIRSGVPRTALFSAEALAHPQHHHLVVQTHRDFLQAGSHILTTSNYGVTPIFYRKHFGAEHFEAKMWEHVQLAVDLAKQAVECVAGTSAPIVPGTGATQPQIWGCVPPVENFRPGLVKAYLAENEAEFFQFYEKLAEIMGPQTDGLLLETMSGARFEIEAVVKAVAKGLQKAGCSNTPIGISFCAAFPDVDNDETPNPEKIFPEIARYVLDLKTTLNVDFLGLNCAPLDEMQRALRCLDHSALLDHLKTAGIDLAVYPNCFSEEFVAKRGSYDRGGKELTTISNGAYLETCYERDGTNDFCRVALLREWRDRYGVTLFGGCCGFAPEHIKCLRGVLGRIDEDCVVIGKGQGDFDEDGERSPQPSTAPSTPMGSERSSS